MDIYQCPSCFEALNLLYLPSWYPSSPFLFSLSLLSSPPFPSSPSSSSPFPSSPSPISPLLPSLLSLSFSLFLSLLPLSPFPSLLWSFFQRKSVDDYDAMGRYSSQYEAQLDPFTAFSAKVRSCFFPVYTQLHSGSYPTGRTHWKQCIVNLLTNGVCYEFQREIFFGY